ncbi:MAG: histidine--tRNA ligase [Candidatus Bathyarchaeia archaeon]|nr:histidine--tRNA ligase [Candidatus Bathyarchaeota archaeon]
MPRKFSLPRGIHDITPEEMAKRVWLFNKIMKIAHLYGFQMVEPATIEHLETLEAKSGSSIKNEIYYFKDKAGRDLGLRFDLTVGITRMVASRYDLPEPIKLYAIGGMWRYDEPQYGRYRYFYQWDAEIYGSLSTLADAEVISFGIDILEEVGLKDFEVKINNRKFMDAFLKKLGLNEEKSLAAMRIIDKLKKKSKNEIEAQLFECGLNESSINKIMELVSINGKPEKALTQLPKEALETEESLKAYNELNELFDYLNLLDKNKKCILDFSVVRGLDYYDGIVFEAYDKGGEDIGAIFGGGRFDNLCKIYGRDIPATGVAGGIERLIISMERNKLFPELSFKPEIFIAVASNEVQNKALEIITLLRKSGFSCDFDLKNRSLKHQLEYANSIGIPIVIIIGVKELINNQVTIKDMKNRKEIKINVNELIQTLTKILN